MDCIHCSAPLMTGQTVCGACGRNQVVVMPPPAPTPPPPQPIQQPAVLTPLVPTPPPAPAATPVAAAPTQAPAPIPGTAAPAADPWYRRAWNRVTGWSGNAWDWFKNSLRIVFAIVCIALWLYGIARANSFLATVPAVGIIYFLPFEVKSFRLMRFGVTAFWITLWLVVFLTPRP